MINKFKLFIAVSALLLCSWTVHADGTVRWVTTKDFTGPGSISEAVAALAGDGSLTAAVDTIRFSSDLKGDTIVFESVIAIGGRNVVIDGEDNHIVLSGNDATRLFYVGALYTTAFFEISNLTLTAGFYTSNGGAIGFTNQHTGGVYRLNNVRFERNTREGGVGSNGGAIHVNDVHLVINHCKSDRQIPNRSMLTTFIWLLITVLLLEIRLNALQHPT
jgi:hypothetical protein